MSDGCTGAPWFSKFSTSHALRGCCARHDEKYYYGGTWRQRLQADVEFYDEILATGEVTPEEAQDAFNAVRLFGGPNGRHPKYSWAFGGDVFAYTDGSDCEHLR